MGSVVVVESLCCHRMSKHLVGWLKYLHTNHLVKRTFQMHYVVADSNFFKYIIVRSYVEKWK